MARSTTASRRRTAAKESGAESAPAKAAVEPAPAAADVGDPVKLNQDQDVELEGSPRELLGKASKALDTVARADGSKPTPGDGAVQISIAYSLLAIGSALLDAQDEE